MLSLIQSIDSTTAAFLAGLVTSVHCSLMCGPIACLLSPGPTDKDSFFGVTALYHVGRIIAYTSIGAIAGSFGLLSLSWVDRYEQSLLQLLPWAMVVFFLAIALRLDRWFFRPALASGRVQSWVQRIRRLPPHLSAAGMGLLTPLLPCAPLYAAFFLALMTQSPARGAEFLFAFALGTLPLLWLVQLGWTKTRLRLTPKKLSFIQRGLAGLAALLIALRLYFHGSGGNMPFCGS